MSGQRVVTMFGCAIESVRSRVRRADIDKGHTAEVSTDDAGRMKLLEQRAGGQGPMWSKRVKTARRDPQSARHAELLDRDFPATAPDRLWVMDLIFLTIWAGVANVRFTLDVFSWMVGGLALHVRTDVALDVVAMARWSRGSRHEDLRCHSDPGPRGGFSSGRFSIVDAGRRSVRRPRS